MWFLCFFCVFEGFEDFFVVFEDFVGFFLILCGVLFVDFCMDLASCPSVSELTLAFWLVLSCVKSISLTPRHEFCLPLLWVLSLRYDRCL